MLYIGCDWLVVASALPLCHHLTIVLQYYLCSIVLQISQKLSWWPLLFTALSEGIIDGLCCNQSIGNSGLATYCMIYTRVEVMIHGMLLICVQL
jgi:hypothetical protein